MPKTLVLMVQAAVLMLASNPSAVASPNGDLKIAMSGEYMPLHGFKAGQPTGLEADIGRALAERLGRRPHFVKPRGKSTLQAVADGDVDVALNAITPTPSRAKLVDFTWPYVQIPYVLAFSSKRSFPSAEALVGHTVAAVRGPGFEAGKKALPAATVRSARNLGSAMKMLRDNQVVAVFGEDVALRPLAKNAGLKLSEFPLGASSIAMAVRSGSLKKFEGAFSGLPLSQLQERWYKPDPSLLSETEVGLGALFAFCGKHAKLAASYSESRGLVLLGDFRTSLELETPSEKMLSVRHEETRVALQGLVKRVAWHRQVGRFEPSFAVWDSNGHSQTLRFGDCDGKGLVTSRPQLPLAGSAFEKLKDGQQGFTYRSGVVVNLGSESVHFAFESEEGQEDTSAWREDRVVITREDGTRHTVVIDYSEVGC